MLWIWLIVYNDFVWLFKCVVSFIDTVDINQIISSNSPEGCQIFLRNLEKKGDPHSDPVFLSRLLDCYSKVFAKFPLAKHCKTECYARMLVRYAELKGWVHMNCTCYRTTCVFNHLYIVTFAELKIQRKLKIISVSPDHTVKLLLLYMLHMLSLSSHKVTDVSNWCTVFMVCLYNNAFVKSLR